jgi:hypothetical protein
MRAQAGDFAKHICAVVPPSMLVVWSGSPCDAGSARRSTSRIIEGAQDQGWHRRMPCWVPSKAHIERIKKKRVEGCLWSGRPSLPGFDSRGVEAQE